MLIWCVGVHLNLALWRVNKVNGLAILSKVLDEFPGNIQQVLGMHIHV